VHGLLSFSERKEVAQFVKDKGIRILNLCHVPEDGRLKTLSFSVADNDRVEEILEYGERIDGSSLFSFIEPNKSDIYLMPELSREFVNPFAATPTLNVMCNYLDENGNHLDIAPKNVLVKAEEKLRSSSSIALKALAELEFYLISKPSPEALFVSASDRNYHESTPFAKFEGLRNEVLVTLAELGISTKYGHCEVGRMLGRDNSVIEQHEVELKPQGLVEMAESVAIAKWVIRNICLKYGVSVSFVPKMALDHAGTGMHVHLCGLRKGQNVIAKADGSLSLDALNMIGGMLKFAPSLAAFGNPTPISYLRFIARKESPMHICWSARNRLALIRVPLWWSFKKMNKEFDCCRETFEYRAPDAFADAFLLLAGTALAVNYGLENQEEASKIAEDLHVETSDKKQERLKTLPASCAEAAGCLRRDRRLYEADEVFPRRLVDKTVDKLEAYRDGDLWKRLMEKPDEVEKLIEQYMHHG